MNYRFTFSKLSDDLKSVLDHGYKILTCSQFIDAKKSGELPMLTLVLRVDIDVSVKKAARLGEIFKDQGINGTFFLRLHANEYNPFAFENYRIIKQLIQEGNEIGYHSEIIDQAEIWNETPDDCLMRDIAVMELVFGIKIRGVASHGGMTGLNNLDFWVTRKPSDFGLDYEAYDKENAFNLFHNSRYISDSEWTKWKAYENGALIHDDRRSFREHLSDKCPLIYLLLHPETFFDRHFYE